MTTNTTNSQAATEIDVEFINLMSAYRNADNAEGHLKARRALVDYHEAKLAQVREEEKNKWYALCLTASNEMLKEIARAEHAEGRLAEIQRGVEGLKNPYLNRLESDMGCGFARCRDDVLALLQPQGQADTSGLLG